MADRDPETSSGRLVLRATRYVTMTIYREIILDHYRSPRNFGKLSQPTASATVSNPVCGDTIVMEVIEENSIIKDIKFSGEGCAISQASASLLTEYAKNKLKDQLKKLDRQFIMKMVGVELGPNRIKCALLSWEALMKIIC